MDISIHCSTTLFHRIARISHVEKDKSSSTLGSSRARANDVHESGVVVAQDIMSPSIGQLTVKSCEISDGIEGDRTFLVIDVQKLSKVKYLDVMIIRFRGNDDIMPVGSDLSPPARVGTSGLWQTTEITKLTSICNLIC